MCLNNAENMIGAILYKVATKGWNCAGARLNRYAVSRVIAEECHCAWGRPCYIIFTK